MAYSCESCCALPSPATRDSTGLGLRPRGRRGGHGQGGAADSCAAGLPEGPRALRSAHAAACNCASRRLGPQHAGAPHPFGVSVLLTTTHTPAPPGLVPPPVAAVMGWASVWNLLDIATYVLQVRGPLLRMSTVCCRSGRSCCTGCSRQQAQPFPHDHFSQASSMSTRHGTSSSGGLAQRRLRVARRRCISGKLFTRRTFTLSSSPVLPGHHSGAAPWPHRAGRPRNKRYRRCTGAPRRPARHAAAQGSPGPDPLQAPPCSHPPSRRAESQVVLLFFRLNYFSRLFVDRFSFLDTLQRVMGGGTRTGSRCPGEQEGARHSEPTQPEGAGREGAGVATAADCWRATRWHRYASPHPAACNLIPH